MSEETETALRPRPKRGSPFVAFWRGSEDTGHGGLASIRNTSSPHCPIPKFTATHTSRMFSFVYPPLADLRSMLGGKVGASV
jgi:hypothetical protein